MTTKTNISEAEIREKIVQGTARIVLVVALMHAASFASQVMSERTGDYLGFLEKGLAVLAVAMAIATLRLVIKAHFTRRHRGGIEPESFINEVVKKSFSISWAVTLILLIFLDLGDGKYIVELPVNSLMDFIKTTLLGSFSMIFFVLNRTSGMDESGDGPGE